VSGRGLDTECTGDPDSLAHCDTEGRVKPTASGDRHSCVVESIADREHLPICRRAMRTDRCGAGRWHAGHGRASQTAGAQVTVQRAERRQMGAQSERLHPRHRGRARSRVRPGRTRWRPAGTAEP
jgi:hypothetical protein